MSAWVVIPCLLSLQKEFDQLNPSRDRGAEGFVADSSHLSTSDHTPDEDSDALRNKDSDHINEVHAYDCDSTGPWPGTNFHSIVMKVIEGEKKKWNDPNDKCRLNYVIHDRVIYDKDNNFVGVTYTGSDPHTNHAHFSGRYETSCENDTRPWGIVATFGDDMSEQDAYNGSTRAMKDFFAAKNAVNKEGQTPKPESRIGHDSNSQRMPADPFIPGDQLMVYEYLGAMGKLMEEMSLQLADIDVKIDAHIAGLVEEKK